MPGQLRSEGEPTSAEPHDAMLGTVLEGRFRLDAVLGRGGMSVVYRAFQADMDRFVAVKMPLQALSGSRTGLQRFAREAQVLSLLDHPNLAMVHAAGVTPDGRPFIAMDLVDGKPLSDWLSAQPALHRLRCLPRFVEMAAAVAHAHEHGVVHRDLKPANVMVVSDGARELVKVLDFGIAKLVDGDTQKTTATGCVLGSPLYMSPEQFGAQSVDNRSDIYSFGCMLYELVAGRPPFASDNVFELLDGHTNQPPPPVSYESSCQLLQQKLHQIALKCMHKDPAQRFQTMSEVRDLLAVIELDPATSLGFSPQKQSSRRTRRAPLVMAWSALLAAFALAGVALYSHNLAQISSSDSRKMVEDNSTFHASNALSLQHAKQWAEAEKEARQALQSQRTSSQRRVAMRLLANILFVRVERESKLEALAIYNQLGEEVSSEYPDPKKRPRVVAQILRDAYERSAEIATNLKLPLETAEPLAIRAYNLAVAEGNTGGNFNVYRYMAKIASLKGDYTTAAKFGEMVLDRLDMHTPPEGNTVAVACVVAQDFLRAKRGTPKAIKQQIVRQLHIVSRDEDWRKKLNAGLDKALQIAGE